MELLKKFQYSLVLFLIAAVILVTGFLPNGSKLLHRAAYPEEYIETRGVIVELERYQTLQATPSYHVHISYVVEETGEEVTAVLEEYIKGMAVDMEIVFLYHTENPQYIFQPWSQISKFLLHGSFTFLAFITAILMMNPAIAPYKHRTPSTLRERLDRQYGTRR